MEISKQLKDKFLPFNSDSSILLSFEGIEGSGKSTHIERTKKFFEAQGKRVIITREPGGTIFGEKLREAILESKEKLSPIAEAHLFASSRAQLLFQSTIKELETPNTVVIYDRYLDSSIAYQGFARGLGPETILNIHSHYPLTIVPSITLYIKISLETSFYRQGIRNNEKDYFESENSDFYTKLIDGYDTAAEIFSERFRIIDGEQDVEGVYTQIESELKKLV